MRNPRIETPGRFGSEPAKNPEESLDASGGSPTRAPSSKGSPDSQHPREFTHPRQVSHTHSEHDEHRAPREPVEHGQHGEHDGHKRHDHSHDHAIPADADQRWLSLALALIVGFMCVEVVMGLRAHSLALLSDAAHMLTDAGAIALALAAMRIGARPARGLYTYGFKRVEILSAQANGLTLLLLSAWLSIESIVRLVHPPSVSGGPVMTIALIGIGVNVMAAWAISKANRASLNVEGAYQHILTDAFGFAATAAAGAVIMLTGFDSADAIASLIVVVLMVRAGIGLVRKSGEIFLEAAPAGTNPQEVGRAMADVDTVFEVHDLHIWQITSGEVALSAHVLVTPQGDCHHVRHHLSDLLNTNYGIAHTTLQVDHLADSKKPLTIQNRTLDQESGENYSNTTKSDHSHGTAIRRNDLPS